MIEISANELNQKIFMILSRIEKGERYIVIREGKPIAEITPGQLDTLCYYSEQPPQEA